ncbi:jg14190 [Pararge aegeria aegeria]|uniref:Jg14190 protein n=1 Tax=Pararge aegeria aegeria TaxID=348720 RepID=A0A8S4S926_9NEOP|nr:jg14190 [Pararge aegeria aegeria]
MTRREAAFRVILKLFDVKQVKNINWDALVYHLSKCANMFLDIGEQCFFIKSLVRLATKCYQVGLLLATSIIPPTRIGSVWWVYAFKPTPMSDEVCAADGADDHRLEYSRYSKYFLRSHVTPLQRIHYLTQLGFLIKMKAQLN